MAYHLNQIYFHASNCTDGYTNSEVNIRWIDNPVKGIDKLELPQFKVAQYRTNTYIEREATGAYVRLSLSFLFKRYIGYFIFQTYLPSILIVMLSWVSFWISHQAISARVALGKRAFVTADIEMPLKTSPLCFWTTRNHNSAHYDNHKHGCALFPPTNQLC